MFRRRKSRFRRKRFSRMSKFRPRTFKGRVNRAVQSFAEKKYSTNIITLPGIVSTGTTDVAWNTAVGIGGGSIAQGVDKTQRLGNLIKAWTYSARVNVSLNTATIAFPAYVNVHAVIAWPKTNDTELSGQAVPIFGANPINTMIVWKDWRFTLTSDNPTRWLKMYKKFPNKLGFSGSADVVPDKMPHFFIIAETTNVNAVIAAGFLRMTFTDI
ncbi:capsid protein [robinz virus RP_513]|nr:capsid protein [robinz virus RP_513]